MKLRCLAIALLACACGPRPRTGPGPRDPDALAHPPTITTRVDDDAGTAEPAALLVAMAAEMKRAHAALAGEGEAKPYFLAYRVTEVDSVEIAASQGALELSTADRERALDVEVRVGSPSFDNYHWHHRTMPGYVGTRSTELWGEPLAIEDDPDVIAHALWSATDGRYKSAIAEYHQARAQQQLAAAKPDDAPDFALEPALRFVQAPARVAIDRAAWEPRLRALSARLAENAELLDTEVRLVATGTTSYVTTSDGSLIQAARGHVRLILSAATKADDGMDLSHVDIVDVAAVDELPTQAELLARADALADQLAALRVAPVAEPFTGPAVLEGRAAAVYFHEVFGHRVEGHRQEDTSEGQTFAEQIGKAVMPAFMDVYDDPTLARIDDTFLNGHYLVDDEGVRARRASLVEAGSFVGFLMSRTPTRAFHRSNGHGRGQAGASPVARQGNLVVAPRQGVTKAQLDARLVELVKAQGKPYGLRFVEISGGVTNTSRYMAQAFQVAPVVVYRVYPDGHEELVRGVTLEGTPLQSLSKIVAAGDRYTVFNGFCGAESGFIPVSAASPPLLLSQIEVARAPAAQDRPPILPAPTRRATAGGAR